MGKTQKSRTVERRRRTLTTDGVISIIAVSACLLALVACAVAHYLSALV